MLNGTDELNLENDKAILKQLEPDGMKLIEPFRESLDVLQSL